MKFGGTSVADQTAIERLIAIVRAQRQADAQQEGGDARGPIVVVSALSKVTDRLLGIAANAGAGDIEGAKTNLRELRQRHTTISQSHRRSAAARAGHRSFSIRSSTSSSASSHALARAARSLAAVARRHCRHGRDPQQPHRRRGADVARAARDLDRRAPRRRDDGDHTAAAPLFQETTAALMAHVDPPLAAGRVPVIGGFVGATADGVTTTLGRGGSDYSAAIVGACLGAGEIQIWTDVDGMLTADPRIVADPFVVPHLSFAEASELAYFGAKVLHPATIQPAVARNIPVRILNSHRPQARGTLITGERPPSSRPLTAIASKKEVSVVSITSTRMLMAHGFLRRLFEVFERWKTAVDVITTSEVTRVGHHRRSAAAAGDCRGAVGVCGGRRRARHGDRLRGRRRAAVRSAA